MRKPNYSIFFLKKHQAVTGILKDGVFTQKKAWRLRGHWTDAVASRDSLLLYDRSTGNVQTGTFVKGIYTKVKNYGYVANLTNLAASCDSVVLYDKVFGFNQTGTLKKGLLTLVDSFTFGPGWDLVGGSCDTLGFMHFNGSLGAAGTFANGEYAFHAGYQPGLNAPTHFVNTGDSYLLYSSSGLSGEWGTATGGTDSGTDHANDFAGWNKIVATADTLLFYNQDGTAAVSTLKGGSYVFKGDLVLSAGWKVIAGGR